MPRDHIWEPRKMVGKLWTAVSEKYISQPHFDFKTINSILKTQRVRALFKWTDLYRPSDFCEYRALEFWDDYQMIYDFFNTFWHKYSHRMMEEYQSDELYVFRLGYDSVKYFVHLALYKNLPISEELKSDEVIKNFFELKPMSRYIVNDQELINIYDPSYSLMGRGDWLDALISDDPRPALCPMLQRYRPIIIFEVFRNIVIKSLGRHSIPLKSYEIEFLNSIYKESSTELRLKFNDDLKGYDIKSVSKNRLFPKSWLPLNWWETLEQIAYFVVCDFVDDLIFRKQYPSANWQRTCVECGQLMEVTVSNRAKKYCSQRCKERAKKRRQRGRKDLNTANN